MQSFGILHAPETPTTQLAPVEPGIPHVPVPASAEVAMHWLPDVEQPLLEPSWQVPPGPTRGRQVPLPQYELVGQLSLRSQPVPLLEVWQMPVPEPASAAFRQYVPLPQL